MSSTFQRGDIVVTGLHSCPNVKRAYEKAYFVGYVGKIEVTKQLPNRRGYIKKYVDGVRLIPCSDGNGIIPIKRELKDVEHLHDAVLRIEREEEKMAKVFGHTAAIIKVDILKAGITSPSETDPPVDVATTSPSQVDPPEQILPISTPSPLPT